MRVTSCLAVELLTSKEGLFSVGLGGRKRSVCLHTRLGEGDLCARWTLWWAGLRLCVKEWQRAWSPPVPGIETFFSEFPACSKLTTLKELPRSLTVQSLGVSKPTARFNPRYNTCNPQNVCMCSICVSQQILFSNTIFSKGLCPLRGTNASIQGYRKRWTGFETAIT